MKAQPSAKQGAEERRGKRTAREWDIEQYFDGDKKVFSLPKNEMPDRRRKPSVRTSARSGGTDWISTSRRCAARRCQARTCTRV